MWALKDKFGKYRSRRGFKQDLKNDSDEAWEIQRRNHKKSMTKSKSKTPILDKAWREINKK